VSQRQRQLFRQRDFSGGEIVPYAKRRDDLEMVRAGCRQLKNRRILQTGGTEQRPGRSALFCDGARVDDVRMSATVTYRLCFAAGVLRIRNSSGVVVATLGGMPWTTAALDKIRWARYNNDIFICFTAMKPIVATWDGSSTWTFAEFAFRNGPDGVPRMPFYRFAASGVTLTISGSPSASGMTGSLTVTASSSVFVSSHVGVVFRFHERLFRVTGYTSGTQVTVTALEALSPTCTVGVTSGADYSVGDVVEGADTGAQGYIAAISTNNLSVILTYRMTGFSGAAAELIVGPRGKQATSGASTFPASNSPSPVWDEQIISDYRGWPQSVSVDQNRLIFSDLVSVPGAVLWSAIGDPYDFKVTADADGAIAEIVPGNPRVYDVVGALSDEFVFTDQGIRNVPISVSNPLTPGSVAFNLITDEPASQVRPIPTNEGVFFVNDAQNRVKVVVGTGQSARPYVVRDVSEMHGHLFSGVKKLAVTSGAGEVVDRYIYALNDDGTMAVGKLNAAKDWIGWTPWESGGSGTFSWVSSLGGDVLTTSLYGSRYLTEVIDADAYLDAQVTLNSIPTALGTGTDSDIQFAHWAGSRIGDMTASGGLAAGFDNTTSQAASACAGKSSATTAYIGKTLTTALPIKKVVVHGSSDAGYVSGANPSVTITLYGKNGSAPANGTDGTSLGSTTFTDTANESSGRTINSSDTATAYTHVWVYVTQAGAAATMSVAEVVFHTPGLTRAASGGGTGSLWFLESQTIDMMDGLSYLGDRAVEADGDVTAEEGDDLTVATLVTGFKWEEVIEPFVPHVGEGQSVNQTMQRRNLGNAAIAVQNSVGFLVRKTDGTLLRRIDPYRVGDNQDEEPTVREEVWVVPVNGSDFDPRFEVARDVPGPNRILEISFDPEV